MMTSRGFRISIFALRDKVETPSEQRNIVLSIINQFFSLKTGGVFQIVQQLKSKDVKSLFPLSQEQIDQVLNEKLLYFLY